MAAGTSLAALHADAGTDPTQVRAVLVGGPHGAWVPGPEPEPRPDELADAREAAGLCPRLNPSRPRPTRSRITGWPRPPERAARGCAETRTEAAADQNGGGTELA